jgi:hypothetical protein
MTDIIHIDDRNYPPVKTDPRAEVRCPVCRSKLFDGEVIKGVTVIRVLKDSAEGKCKQCKGWVGLPVSYSGICN